MPGRLDSGVRKTSLMLDQGLDPWRKGDDDRRRTETVAVHEHPAVETAVEANGAFRARVRCDRGGWALESGRRHPARPARPPLRSFEPAPPYVVHSPAHEPA